MDSFGDPCGFPYDIVDAKHVLFLQHTNVMQEVKYQPVALKPTCPYILRTWLDNIPYASACKLGREPYSPYKAETLVPQKVKEKLDTPPVREYFESVGLDVRDALGELRSEIQGSGSCVYCFGCGVFRAGLKGNHCRLGLALSSL